MDQITHHVKKFGGENAADVLASVNFIREQAQNLAKQAVVVSAMRSDTFNTTNKLIKIGEKLEKMFGDFDVSKSSQAEVFAMLQEIEEFHLLVVREKLADCPPQVLRRVEGLIGREFQYFSSCVQKFLDAIPDEKNRFALEDDFTISISTLGEESSFSILGFGETLSASIFSEVLNQISQLESSAVRSQIVNTSTLIGAVVENKEEAFRKVSHGFGKKAGDILNTGQIAVIPGYVSNLPGGIIESIGRGYSDATAGAVAVGLQNRAKRQGFFSITELHILKAVKGFLSIDPKIARKGIIPRLIKLVNYFTAREMTGGASVKALNEEALRSELQEAGIVVRLYNPLDMTNPGTMITPEGDTESEGVINVSGKEAIVFSVSSSKMMGTGYLARVFAVAAKYVSVGVVSTSETEITFTIDAEKGALDVAKQICEELGKELSLPIKQVKTNKEITREDRNKDQIILRESVGVIFCIGENMADKVGLMAKATGALAEKGINNIANSQGTMQRAMIFIVESDERIDATNILHDALVPLI